MPNLLVFLRHCCGNRFGSDDFTGPCLKKPLNSDDRIGSVAATYRQLGRLAALRSIAVIRIGSAENRSSDRLLWPIPDVERLQFRDV